MGVKSLWTLLTPVGRPVMLETVEGKVMAIDSSIWIYQFQATMRDKEGRGLVNAHVLGFLRRITKLLFYGIKPVFVFDGGAPVLKRATLNERKKKKAGAALSHAQLAEKILAAKMRREALEHASGGQSSGKKAARNVPLDDDTVYLEDIDNSKPKTPKKAKPPGPSSSEKKKRFHDHDPYHLPEVDLDAAIAKRTRDPINADPRLATEDELHAFLSSITPEDLDITSPEFHTLPTSIQYELIGDLRLKSRQTSHARLQKMLRSSQTPLDFSKAQIAHLKERNQLTQRLLMTTDSIGSAHIAIPVRIASERNKEYVLVKNANADGGWILAIRDMRGTEEKPIVLDHDDENNQLANNGKVHNDDNDADMEQVTSVDPDLRAYQREMALGGIGVRSNNSRKTIPTAFWMDGLDSEDRPSSSRHTPRTSTPLQDPEGDDDLLALAIQQSLDYAKDSQPEPASPSPATPPRKPVEASYVEIDDDDDMYMHDFTPLGTALSFANAGSRPLASPTRGDSTPKDLTSRSEVATTSQPTISFSFKGTGLLGTLKESEPELVPPKNIDDGLSQQQREMNVLSKQTNRLLQEEESDQDDDDMEEVVDFPADIAASFVPPTPPQEQPQSDAEESDDDMEEVIVKPPTETPAITNARTAPSPPPIAVPKSSETSSHQTRKDRLRDAFVNFDIDMKAIEISVPVVEKSAPFLPEKLSESVPAANSVQASTQAPTAVDSFRFQRPVPISAATESLLPLAPSPPILKDSTKPSSPKSGAADPIEDNDSDEELIPWSRSPSPTNRGLESVHDEGAHATAWDAAQEMDPHAEEGEFVKFVSQVKGKNMDSVRQEIDDELRVLNQQKKAAMRDAEDVTQQMITQIMIMLRLFGIPYITAPMEAEAQCAELVTLGLVDGVITDDSDVFLFGAQRVYKNMFNQSKTVECFLASDLSRELGLTRDTLIQLAYLLGSDYTEGLPGVGPVVAMELLKEFPGSDGLFKFRDWWLSVQSGKDKADSQSPFKRRFKKRFKDLYLSNDWPNTAVRDAYYHPAVDSSEEPFKWGIPDLDGLHQFLHQELGWQSNKVDELLLPIIQKINKRREAAASNQQGVLNQFLDISGSGTHAPRQRQAYASKRLQQVVSDFRKRQKRSSVTPDGNEGAMDIDDQVDEEDNLQTTARKRRRQSSTPNGPAQSKTSKKPRAAKKHKKKVQKSTSPSDTIDDSPTNSDEGNHDGNGPSTGKTADEDAGRGVALSLRPRPKPRPTYKGANSKNTGTESATHAPTASSGSNHQSTEII